MIFWRVTSTDRPSATGFESSVGVEHIDLPNPFKIEGRVEYYLQELIDQSVKALRGYLDKSNKAFVTDSTEVWVKREPNQIILTTSLTFFTLKMEETFSQIAAGHSDAMKDMFDFKVEGLTGHIDLVRTKLTKAERMKIMCLITLDAHSRDISFNLREANVTERTQFEWQSQLRFEWREKENDCYINIVDAEFTYSFEYIGNGARLVITPLTDRIYVTATQALKLCMGCAPAGPAGTGKTETTKDLAAMMAVCIYVFNCAPEMDYRSLGDIWKGLGASGAWGCFDEFNRLIAEVLSVCSTQYKCILDSLVAKRDTFVLDGAELKINYSVGAYITMNPGYIGRTPLPESLKALFRPVTVVVPDFALICENMLMSEGYTQARLLGVKFINLYTLCGDLLSKAKHYDWGLRAIKSVLRVAGDFKRNEPEVSELALLFRALRDFNVPKIVGDDWIVYQGLLGDLFPGIDIPRQRNWDNEKVISEVCVENNLQPDDNCLLKIVQLDELMSIRHSIFLMGPSGTGKSTCWKMLSVGCTCVCARAY
jgi:dynein heavy chain